MDQQREAREQEEGQDRVPLGLELSLDRPWKQGSGCVEGSAGCRMAARTLILPPPGPNS